MPAPVQVYGSMLSERDLRRQLDRCVSLALVDREYRAQLLADPTVILKDRSCPRQQYLALLTIQATTLLDFARQAQALLWPIPHGHTDFGEREPQALAAVG